MIKKKQKVAGFLYLVFLAGIITVSLSGQTFAQIGIQIPKPDKVVDLFEPTVFGLERIASDSSLFQITPRNFKRTVDMDSTGRFISIREALDNTDLYLPAVIDLSTYVQMRLDFDRRELWKNIVVTNFKEQVDDTGGAITLDIPFRIKSKTFTRIFGSDRIGLRVTGNISFDLSGRTEERSGSAISALENQNTFSPRFKQTQQFTVEGHIGEKVTVSVEQNSEAITDIENTLKLRYKGDEDEIVQSIEAGNIGLSLPSTKYVIFGGSNKGLFGLKTSMKVGNLHFTGIASLEKGQQQELSISGGSSESTTTIRDIDFIKNRYFFIDTPYYEYWEQGLLQDPLTWTYPQGTDIIQIDVWKSVLLGDADVRYGIALLDPTELLNSDLNYKDVDPDAIEPVEGEIERGNFKKLNENEYTFDRYRGFISLKQAVSTNEVLAVSYVVSARTQDPNVPTIGTLEENLQDSTQAVVLKLLKPRNLRPSHDKVWPLMMRNVYSLGGSKIEQEGFEVRLEYNKNGNHETHPTGSETSFLHRTGLDLLNHNGEAVDGGDEVIDNNGNLVNRADGILMFPSLQPFFPDKDGPYGESMPEEYLVDMYQLPATNNAEFLDRSKFEMIVKSRSTKSTFDLGFYVLEQSEVVTLGGRTLERDKDYMIDYFSGQLTLLSPEAKRSSSNIDITYERANLFQLDKKTILGGRLEYRLWDDGFIGLTALYLNKSTLDRRVRVGQEPFDNFVWDINAAFKFKPRFLTRAIDALPLIDTNAESHFNIEGEFAQVLPNPNTLNSESTGDDNGVAYIDDFEAAKRTTTLGIRYRTWSVASPPSILPKLGERIIPDIEADRARATVYWFNPYVQVPIKDIWPNRDVNSQTGQTTDVLGVELQRDPQSDPDSAWAGFMRSTASFPDQQKTKYIELWVKGNVGTVHIDIGQISEDWYLGESFTRQNGFGSGRGVLNYEDVNNNGLLDEGEDTGIDGIFSPDGDPFDNWSEPQREGLNIYDRVKYDGINGTEGNSNSREARYPDTEDLDGDGQLNTFNAYYEYSFSLDSMDTEARRWISGSTPRGWRQFRIPINEWTRKIGSPDPNFQQILNFRVWFDDLPTERTRIFIATLDFVGNEWEEIGISPADTNAFVRNDTLFTLETYNTEENAEAVEGREAYRSPPGVAGVRDRITNALSKEQSLVMRFFDLQPGEKAEAKKQLYNSLDLSNYERMKMFIHGDQFLPDRPPPDSPDSSKIRFYVKFGADGNNYYEYGQDIYAHWSPLNNMNIDLDDMTGIKFFDSLKVMSAEKTIYEKKLPDVPGGYYRAVGNPSIKTTRYFIIGAENRDFKPFVGEIWLDELRLSDVRKENATAMRLQTDIKLADFISFNAQWESKDADFHNVSTQFGKGNTEERQNYSGKIYLGKLLPDDWDISFPVDGRASFSRSVPKYFPRTDKLTNYKNDTFEKKLQSLFGLREIDEELEKQSSKSEVMGLGTTIRKRSKSQFWLFRYTVDQLLLDVDYSYKKSSSWETKFNRSESFKESVKYGIPFDSDNFIMPLKWASNIPLIKELSDQKLFYTPNKVDFSLNVSEIKTASQRRSTGEGDAETNYEEKRTNDINSTRSISSSYKMLNSLNFSYTRNHRANADYVGLTHKELLKQIVTRGYFGLETDINQNFKGDFKPDLFSWLKADFSYTAGFRYQLTNGYKYKGSSNNVQKRIGLTFSPGGLVKAIYTPEKEVTKTTRSRRGRSRRGKATTQQDEGKEQEAGEEEDKEDEEDDDEGSAFFNPLTLFYNALTSWQSVRAALTIDENVANKFLTDVPTWEYQFGLSQNPGVPQDTALGGTVNLVGPVHSNRVSLRTSTSLDIMKNVKINLTHDLSETENISEYGSVRSGTRSRTYFVTGDNPLEEFDGFDSDIKGFIPDWTVQVSGLEKMLFFPEFAKTMTLDHGHSSKYSENLRLNLDQEYLPNTRTFTNSWQPLVGVNVRTLWGVNATMRLTDNTSYSFNAAAGATKTESSSMTFNLTYSVTSGFKIPIPIWPFKGKTFKNEINMSLTYDSSSNTTFQKQFDSPNFEEKQKNSSWKLRPSATYRFSSRVQGSLFYETGSSENKISGEYSYNEFGITVNIAIRD